MRIAILGDAGSIHIHRVARGLAGRGHAVRVICHKPTAIPGVTVERFSVPGPGWRYPARWERRRAMYLRGIMRSHDVVHVNFLSDWGLTPEIVSAGRLLATPLGSDIVKPPDLGEYPAGVLSMRRELLRMSRRVAVYGRSFANVVAGFAGMKPGQIAQVPLGVDLDRFRPRQSRSNGQPAVVGFFKGFKAVYGPTAWLQAIPRVLGRVPEARFDFVGRGPMLPECQALAEMLGVARAIRWFDHQTEEALPGVIDQWKVSVIPSVCESFGVAALESAAMEVPVVACRVGGLPDTVRDGETGTLVSPRDIDGLGDAVADLLRNEPRRRAMAVRGRDFVGREYEWGRCLDRLIQVYSETLDASHA
jgi:glycosyltransferase involved in cell wall biosynthesis